MNNYKRCTVDQITITATECVNVHAWTYILYIHTYTLLQLLTPCRFQCHLMQHQDLPKIGFQGNQRDKMVGVTCPSFTKNETVVVWSRSVFPCFSQTANDFGTLYYVNISSNSKLSHHALLRFWLSSLKSPSFKAQTLHHLIGFAF